MAIEKKTDIKDAYADKTDKKASNSSMEKSKLKAAPSLKGVKSTKVDGYEGDKSLLALHEELWELELDKEQQERMVNLAEHLVSSYEKSDDTVTLYHNIAKWNDQYEGLLPPKDYPWEGCANYHVPITEMNVNAYYARIIRRFRGMDYLKVKQYREIQKRAILTQRYLRYLFLKKIGYVDLCMTVVREIIKYGTGVFCTTFEFKERKKKAVVPQQSEESAGKDPFTGEDIMIPKVDYAIEEHTYFDMAPKVEYVDLLDYFRSDDSDRFAVPAWEARRIWKSAIELWGLGNSGEYDKENVMALLRKEIEQQDSDTSKQNKGMEYLGERELIEWWGWMRLTKDPLSEPVRIVLTYDRKSNKFLKAIRFPYFYDESCFDVINFERRATTWRGRGICEKLEQLNAELDKLHNIQIDSAALVASKSFKKKRGADTNFLLEDFYPGVVWTVNKMDDIQVMELGDTPVSLLREAQELVNLGEKQTSIGSLQMGQESGAVSQPTASGQLAVLQEGNVLSDEITKEFSEATIRIARKVLSMIRQFRPEDEILEVEDEESKDKIIPQVVDIEELIEDPELIVVDRSILEETEYKNKAIEIYNIVRSDPVLSQIPRIFTAAVSNLIQAYKILDDDLLLPDEQEIQEVMQRSSEMAQLQKLQEAVAKGQMQMQLAQIQAAVKQQQMAVQQQEGQANRQAQAGENERDRQLQLEMQAREQQSEENQAAQAALQQGGEGLA